MAGSSVSPSADARTTITVPAAYAEDFLAGIAEEMAFETEAAREARGKLADHLESENERLARVTATDVDGAMGFLEKLSAILADTGYRRNQELEVRGGLDVLPHIFEAVARKIVGPRLADALQVGPIDEDWAADSVRPLIAELTWAIDTGAELHGAAAEEREAKREAQLVGTGEEE